MKNSNLISCTGSTKLGIREDYSSNTAPSPIPCKIGVVGPSKTLQCLEKGQSMQCKNPLANINGAPDESINICINQHNSKYVSLNKDYSNMQCCDKDGLFISSNPDWTGYELKPSPTQPDESYNCNSTYACQDPGDGSGTYKTLPDCTTNCKAPATSWECSGSKPVTSGGKTYPAWTCVNLQQPGGRYSTEAECKAHCTDQSHVTYVCDKTKNKCVDPGDGSGMYKTLDDCKKGTGCPRPPPITWSCNKYGGCEGISNGKYKDFASCKTSGCKNNSTLIMIILISLIVMVLGSVGLYFMFAKKK